MRSRPNRPVDKDRSPNPALIDARELLFPLAPAWVIWAVLSVQPSVLDEYETEVARLPNLSSVGRMTRVSDERALWLSRCVLPHEPALRLWLKGRRVVPADIDDIVQETYAKLVSLETVDAIRDARSYTFQTAYSIFVTRLRRARVVSISSVADLDKFGCAAPDASPEKLLEDRDELYQLATALADLPHRCRKTFIMRRVEGLSQREVSELLGISEKTIEKHMARGIRFLMDRFGRGGKSSPDPSRQVKQAPSSLNDQKALESGD